MGRGKLPLKLIPKERARRITFAKRKRGLLKKAYELSTLCDVKVCVIVYDITNKLSPECSLHHHHDRHRKQQQQHIPLYTWPEEPQEVESIIAKYLAYKAKNPVSKKDLDLTDFFKEKIKKIQHETKNIMMMNHKSSHHYHDEFDFLWDTRIDGFSLTQLYDLMIHLDRRISEADKHWTDLYNNKNNNNMIMCVTPHEKYYDIDHHHHHQNNNQFGSTSSTVSPLTMMVQDHHIGSSFQTTSSDYHHDHNYNINNSQVVFIPQYHYYNNNNPQYNYFWRHDHPAASSSSKTVPFDHRPSGSFMSMMLNSHDQTDHNEDSGQHYGNLMNIGSTMFNNNNSIGSNAITLGISSTDHDYSVIHHQNGVFLNNQADVFGCSAAHGLGYAPAGNQFCSNNSQQVVNFCDNQPHGFGKAPAGF